MIGLLGKRSFWYGTPLLMLGVAFVYFGIVSDAPIRGTGRNPSPTYPWQVVIAGVVLVIAGLALLRVAWRHRHDSHGDAA